MSDDELCVRDDAWKQDPILFVGEEANLLDERQFEAWAELFTPDGIYWVPGDRGDATDPNRHVSIIYDDEASRRFRIRRLQTGRQFAQDPPSRTCRILGDVCQRVVDLGSEARGCRVTVATNFVVHEYRVGKMHVYPGRARFSLISGEDGLRIMEKKVLLLNSDQYIDNLTFIL